MSKRAKRRFHNQRVKKKARRLYKEVYLYEDEEQLKYAERIADNLKTCQHSGCGNVRRDPWYGGVTRREYEQYLELEEYRQGL